MFPGSNSNTFSAKLSSSSLPKFYFIFFFLRYKRLKVVVPGSKLHSKKPDVFLVSLDSFWWWSINWPVSEMSSRRLSFVELVLVRSCSCHQQRLFYDVLFLFLSVTSKRELQQKKKLHQFSRTNNFYVRKKNIPTKERWKRKKTIDFEIFPYPNIRFCRYIAV